MKITTNATRKFIPQEITIKFEYQAEADLLYALFSTVTVMETANQFAINRVPLQMTEGLKRLYPNIWDSSNSISERLREDL